MNPLNEPVRPPSGQQTVSGLKPITDSRARDGKGRRRDNRKRRRDQTAPVADTPPTPPPGVADDGHIDVMA